MVESKIGFVGGGQMATALISGVLGAELFRPEQICVVEKSSARVAQLKQLFPAIQFGTEYSSLSGCGQIVLALKPHILRQVGSAVGEQLSGDRLWISIAAGVSIDELEKLLKVERLVRVMPNTPAQVGAGAAGFSCRTTTSAADIESVKQLIGSVGLCLQVDHSMMHAVTGIAGSSPAYVYMIIEAMADGGVLGGLPRDVAIQLAAQSVLGAAKMVLDTGLHPGQLKDQVTSPSGTTIAAIRQLEAAGVRSAFIEAVQAATARARELEQS